MIVDQFNTSLFGGAATAAIRLHQSLRAAGVASHYWYGEPCGKRSPPPHASRLTWNSYSLPTLSRRLAIKQDKIRFLKRRPPGYEIFTDARHGAPTPLDRARQRGDLLHLHWVAKWIDLPSFFASIPDTLPVVWTLHDMNPMTGGCHHADGCRRFESGCGRCPQLSSGGQNAAPASGLRRLLSPGDDLSAKLFRLKESLLRGKNLHIVTPSRWMERHVRRSALLGDAASIQTIHNGLDLGLFRPHDKMEARRLLGIPQDVHVIGCGAVSLANPRKGFAEMLAAFTRLPQKSQVLGLAFGSSELPKSDRQLPPIQMLGYVDDPQRQALIYSAMDVFVLPSWAENMPQTAIEAMACGTSVVAFDVGGVPEIVRPMETGLLAPLRDVEQLAERIDWLLTHAEQRKQMGERARQLVEREFELTTQSQRIIELYRTALDSAAGTQPSREAYRPAA